MFNSFPVAAIVLLLVASPTTHGEDWNQWRGAHRDGVAADSPRLISELPEGGLQPAWISEPVKSGGEGGWGSPVVADGRVYLFAHVREKVRDLDPPQFPALNEEQQAGLSEAELAEYEQQRAEEEKERRRLQFQFREYLHCFDAESGETLWSNESDSLYTQFPQSGSPTVLDGRVYILGAGRRARCIDAVSGENVWEQTLPGEFDGEFYQSSLAVLDGIVVATADRLFGIGAGSGAIIWESTAEQRGVNHSSPATWISPEGPLVICNLDGGWTGCFRPQDGSELWRVQSHASVATPVVVGDQLITYGNNRRAGLRCFAMTMDGADEQWVFQGAQDKGGSPLVFDGQVYVQGESRVACVNLETGEAAWVDYLNLRDPQYTSLAAADGKVFYAYESLICFEATAFEFRPLFDGRFEKTGLMATEEMFRSRIAAEQDSDVSQEDIEKQLHERLGNPPLGCASPAIADGRIYLRLRNTVACYDLRERPGIVAGEKRAAD